MKKLASILSIILFFICTYLCVNTKDRFYNYFSNFSSATFCYVYAEDFSSKDYDKIIASGGYKLAYFSKLETKKSGKVKYFEVRFNGDRNVINNIILDLGINPKFSEKVGEISVTYGYSPYFNKCCQVANQKINFQIAVRGSQITIGYPMIYTSF